MRLDGSVVCCVEEKEERRRIEVQKM